MTTRLTPTNIALTCILLILLVTVGIFVYHMYVFVKNKGVPTIATFTKQRTLFLEHIHISPRSTIIDLGCGYGGMLRYICRHHDIAKAIGVDLNGRAIRRGNTKRHLYAKILKKPYAMRTQYILHTQNITDTDLSQADTIYIYMLPHVLADLETYIQQHIAPHTQVISNTFQFPNWKPTKIIYDEKQKPQLYIYHNSPIA